MNLLVHVAEAVIVTPGAAAIVAMLGVAAWRRLTGRTEYA